MKKCFTIFLCLLALAGCEYSDDERKGFYTSCMKEHTVGTSGFLEILVVACACNNWSHREDIKPYSEEKRFDQFIEEKDRCWTEPIKMNYYQRDYFLEKCHETFLKITPSLAQQLTYTGLTPFEVMQIGAFSPEIYKQGSNEDLVDCACRNLSTRPDFIVPHTIGALRQEYEKEVAKCKK